MLSAVRVASTSSGGPPIEAMISAMISPTISTPITPSTIIRIRFSRSAGGAVTAPAPAPTATGAGGDPVRTPVPTRPAGGAPCPRSSVGCTAWGALASRPGKERASPSAATNSPQLPYRSSGFFASARPNARSTAAGRSGRTSRNGAGGMWTTWYIRAGVLSAANGTVPASISYAITASAYWSLLLPTGRPSACSGDMYAGVPITTPLRVSRVPCSARAIPKSVSVT